MYRAEVQAEKATRTKARRERKAAMGAMFVVISLDERASRTALYSGIMLLQCAYPQREHSDRTFERITHTMGSSKFVLPRGLVDGARTYSSLDLRSSHVCAIQKTLSNSVDDP